MANWKCSKCNIEVEKVEDVKIHFNDLDLPEAKGYRCPICKTEFLDGKYVVEELASIEQMLEGK